jgi:hypothetical protein
MCTVTDWISTVFQHLGPPWPYFSSLFLFGRGKRIDMTERVNEDTMVRNVRLPPLKFGVDRGIVC